MLDYAPERVYRTTSTIPRAQEPRFERIERLFREANLLRQRHGQGILAELAVGKICNSRSQKDKKRNCYIIDSIVNPAELETLRLVYGNMFYFIGVDSSQADRERNLESDGITKSDVVQLIDRDSGEELDHEHTVAHTFPQADFFLRIDSGSDSGLKVRLERFLNLVFGTKIITPTPEEKAMHMAASASGNSACLSRQVGAALMDADGEIVSVGWNDVPKFGGGLYHSSSRDFAGEKDVRCMNWESGKCFNDVEKNRMSRTIVTELVQAGLIAPESLERAQQVVRQSKLRNLMEFSRSVHAEMHAIILGSQQAGDRVRGGKLFCTTYPCHSCARHIILAGVKEVYYIEPYRKSLAVKLHKDAITEEENDTSRVRILLFDGVSPTRYLKFFRMLPDSRKERDEGVMLSYNRRESFPKSHASLRSVPAREDLILDRLKKNRLIS